MRTSLKVILEQAMEKFLDDTADHNDKPAGYQHPEICRHMANAAEAVYDATYSSSAYTEQEVTP
jgi:hypothetical protein